MAVREFRGFDFSRDGLCICICIWLWFLSAYAFIVFWMMIGLVSRNRSISDQRIIVNVRRFCFSIDDRRSVTGIRTILVPWQGVQTLSLKSNFSTYSFRQNQRMNSRIKQSNFNKHDGRERVRKTSLYDISELLDGADAPDINLQKQLHFRLMSFEGFSKSFENSKKVISVLEKLQQVGMRSSLGTNNFIHHVLMNVDPDKLDDLQLMQLLKAVASIAKKKLPIEDQTIATNLLDRISNQFIHQSFSQYCDYFYILAQLSISWNNLRIEKRVSLLSDLLKFENIQDDEIHQNAVKLFTGVNRLYILKNHSKEMEERVRECYEKLFIKVLKAKYLDNGRDVAVVEGGGNQFSFVALSQLKALMNLKRTRSMSEEISSLIYKGLKSDWHQMSIYEQAFVIFALGESHFDYNSFPKEDWAIMMEDLTKNLKNDMKPKSLSSLLKGWMGMHYKWRDMNKALKDQVLAAVVQLCQRGDFAREVANSIFYLGGLEVDWNKDMREKHEEILQGLNQVSMYLNKQELANALLGLAYMKASWDDETQLNFLLALENLYDQMNEQELSNSLYSLGQLNMPWKKLPRQLREKLLHHLIVVLKPKDATILALDGSLNGLTNMGYDWKENSKFYQLVLEKINHWFGDKTKITEFNRKILPKLVYSLGAGQVQWRTLGNESKQALITGIGVYCRGNQLTAKDVSNMIYGLKNMEATIYNLPTSLTDALQDVVQRISSTNEVPQHTANILHSFRQFQYLWDMLSEETQKALLHMILESSDRFNPQELGNTCYNVAVMMNGNTSEYDKSSFFQLNQSLLRRYYELSSRNGKVFLKEEMSQLAVYFNWLETLPPSFLSTLLESLRQKELPDINDIQTSSPSDFHQRFTKRVQEAWKALVLKESSAGNVTEERKEELLGINFVNEFQGVRRQTFPIDIAVIQKHTSSSSGKKVLYFIEIDGAGHQHKTHGKRKEEVILNTVDRLKEDIYRHCYKNVPIERLEKKGLSDDHVERMVEKIWAIVSINAQN